MENSRRDEAARRLIELGRHLGVELQVTSTSSSQGQGSSTSANSLAGNAGQHRTITPGRSDQEAASVLSEVRDIMAPYSRGAPLRLSGRSAGRPAFQRATAISRLSVAAAGPTFRTCTQRFCCLAGPNDDLSPTTDRIIALQENGLGEEVVTLSKRCKYFFN